MVNLESFYLGPAYIEPLRNLICVNKKEIRIEHQAMQVLVYLAKNPDKVCTRDAILAAAWPETFPSDGVLAKAICTLRKALGDKAQHPTYIETIPKIGYRLIAPVQLVSEIEEKTRYVDDAANEEPAKASSTFEKKQAQPRPAVPPNQRTISITYQTAALVLFVCLSGVLALLLFSQPDYQMEDVTVLKTYDITDEGRIDSTVIVRTNMPLDAERNLLPVHRSPVYTDTTIEVIKLPDGP